MAMRNSRLGGFYQLKPFERLQMVKSFDGLNDEDLRQLHGGNGALTVERADKMIENVIGTFNLPIGIATNFQINGIDTLIPMVVEEPSIVAGASYAAKLVRAGGGFHTSSTLPLMISQIQLVGIDNPEAARSAIDLHRTEILDLANRQSNSLVHLGGGAQDIEVRFFAESPMGAMLIAWPKRLPRCWNVSPLGVPIYAFSRTSPTGVCRGCEPLFQQTNLPVMG
jgi:hydroxymethylglutaryl-CoA reductase